MSRASRILSERWRPPKKRKPVQRDPVARELVTNPNFRKQVVRDKTIYWRKGRRAKDLQESNVSRASRLLREAADSPDFAPGSMMSADTPTEPTTNTPRGGFRSSEVTQVPAKGSYQIQRTGTGFGVVHPKYGYIAKVNTLADAEDAVRRHSRAVGDRGVRVDYKV